MRVWVGIIPIAHSSGRKLRSLTDSVSTDVENNYKAIMADPDNWHPVGMLTHDEFTFLQGRRNLMRAIKRMSDSKIPQ